MPLTIDRLGEKGDILVVREECSLDICGVGVLLVLRACLCLQAGDEHNLVLRKKEGLFVTSSVVKGKGWL